MVVKEIKIKSFKTLKDVELRDIPGFAVIVGANGAGKTMLYGSLSENDGRAGDISFIGLGS